jgi:hypothetical protein
MSEQELIEALAAKEHASWARWMAYLFSRCERVSVPGRGGPLFSALRIPPELVERWQRQITTPYAELSETEKQSDREEVAHILPIIKQFTRASVSMGSAIVLPTLTTGA